MKPHTLPSLQVGDMAPEKGIYVGVWTLAGGILCTAFNVFAAPADMNPRSETGKKRLLTFDEAAQACPAPQFSTADTLRRALKSGAYQGEFVMPFIELLDGRYADGTALRPDGINLHPYNDLYRLKNHGNFAGSLTVTDKGVETPGQANWYGSCSPDLKKPGAILSVNMATGARDSSYTNISRFSFRLVRFEPLPKMDRMRP